MDRPKHGSQDQEQDRANKNEGNRRVESQKKSTGKKVPSGRDSRINSSQPQVIPLNAYIGIYWHSGYHTMTVKIKDSKLFIDATDRSLGFTLTFDHIRDQTMYTAHLSDMWEGGDDPVEAQFVLKDGRAVKLGLRLEFALKELVWFERVREG